MKKVIILLIVITICAVGFFAGYRYIYKQEDKTLKLSGELEMYQVEVGFRVPGVINSKEFSEGDKVKAGDVLAILDNTTYVSQVDLAKANEEAAKWGLEDLKSNLKKAGTTKKELVEQTTAQVKAATINREMAEQQLAYTILQAPIDGVVIVSYKEKGEMVPAGSPVFSIGNTNALWLKAYLPETKIGEIKVGQKMKVTVDSFPGKIFEGKVSYISDEAEFTPKQIQTTEERVKLVYKVKIDIIDNQGLLKAGIPADAVSGE